MPKWMTVAFALFLSLQVFSTKGETVDNVVSKYINAMGGRERLNAIKTVSSEGYLQDKGKKFYLLRHTVQNRLCRTTISSGSESKSQIITPSEGWEIDSCANYCHTLTKQAVRNLQSQLDCAGPLVDYIAKGHSAELLGKEVINGNECYKIRLRMKSGLIVNYFIDTQNWYVIREMRYGSGTGLPSNTEQGPETIINYMNYKKSSDGLVFPFYIVFEKQAIAVTYQDIRVNKIVTGRLYKP